MVATLRRVGMRRPGAILQADPERWHYSKPIDAEALQKQYETFVDLVTTSGTEIVWFDETDPGPADDLADSIFTYDPSFVVGEGAIILRPGKELRSGEAELHRAFYERSGIPILGQIDAPGMIEGGDCFWLDGETIAIGRGFRTNQHGIDQFAMIVERGAVSVEVFDLPYLHGPEACLHLMSVVSPLDTDLALVHAPLMPTALYQRMVQAGYTLIHAPIDEFDASLGLNLNVLALSPRRCLAIAGFPKTVQAMRLAGCDVTVFEADELCVPCEGGPTCLTRPLLRG